MRIIDLLNKKANGEETPKKFKYDDLIFEENKYGFYIDNKESNLIDSIYYDYSNLNDEIEIIEDTPKILKKIKVGYNPDIEEKIFYEDGDKTNLCILGDAGTELLIDKINEIINCINEGVDK